MCNTLESCAFEFPVDGKQWKEFDAFSFDEIIPTLCRILLQLVLHPALSMMHSSHLRDSDVKCVVYLPLLVLAANMRGFQRFRWGFILE